jgi:hypothetical protein
MILWSNPVSKKPQKKKFKMRSYTTKNMNDSSKDGVINITMPDVVDKETTVGIEPYLNTNNMTNNSKTSPTITFTNPNTDRNIVSLGKNENFTNGIEIIRENESPTIVEKKPPTKMEKPAGNGLIKTGIKHTTILPPVEKVKRAASITSSISSGPPTYNPKKNESKVYNFDDLTSFINPDKQKHQTDDASQKSAYSDSQKSTYSNDKKDSYYHHSNPFDNRSVGSKSVDSYNQSYKQHYQQEPREDTETKWRREEEEKQEILIKLQQLESKGVRLSREFSMKSKLEDLNFELERQKAVISEQESVKFMQNSLVTFVHGVEIMNKKWDPIGAKLNGWSNSVMEDIGSYEGIFERLHEKYQGSVEMAPELELLMTLAQSAFMFHLMETIFKGALPNLGAAIQSDPNLMKGLMSATARAADVGNVPTRQAPTSHVPQPSNVPMQGPSFNIGEMLGPLMGSMMGGVGAAGMNRQGPMGGGPTVPPMGMGVNAFRSAMDRAPPQPMSTREVYQEREKNYVPPRSRRSRSRDPFEDDLDRFSIASSKSDGSEIRSNNITITTNKDNKRKTINI